MSRLTHGMKYHKFYSTWDSMMQRCNNPNCTNYKNYGNRGIKVSEEFKNCKTFIDYIESLPNYSDDKQIDRIDNEKGYERNNLKWSDRTEQNLNKRVSRTNSTGYTGVSKAVNSARYRSYLFINNQYKNIGIFDTVELAVNARNAYIIANNLKHKIQKYIK